MGFTSAVTTSENPEKTHTYKLGDRKKYFDSRKGKVLWGSEIYGRFKSNEQVIEIDKLDHWRVKLLCRLLTRANVKYTKIEKKEGKNIQTKISIKFKDGLSIEISDFLSLHFETSYNMYCEESSPAPWKLWVKPKRHV